MLQMPLLLIRNLHRPLKKMREPTQKKMTERRSENHRLKCNLKFSRTKIGQTSSTTSEGMQGCAEGRLSGVERRELGWLESADEGRPLGSKQGLYL